jgi:thiol:disulfide interchange protein DsbD
MRWEFLTRDRFLAIWVVLFAMAGLYLLGFLRLEGIEPNQKMGVSRLLIGSGFLAFALSLLPGMFGGRLGEIEAYVPPPAEGTGFLAAPEGGGLVWMKDQYEEALALARAENKLVFVNFTGYACTNCHWMKANMFTRPEIIAALSDYILVDLYTDGTDDASLRNQQLQESKFQSIAMPYYAILDGDQNVLATFVGLTRDTNEFLEFLRSPAGRG